MLLFSNWGSSRMQPGSFPTDQSKLNHISVLVEKSVVPEKVVPLSIQPKNVQTVKNTEALV